MPFSVTQKTLEQLEWGGILDRLARHVRTPRAAAHLDRSAAPETLFAATAEEMRERLAETSEARAILASGDVPPLGGIVELREVLGRARRGGVLGPAELLDLAATLTALQATARFAARRREIAPRLAAHAQDIGEQPGLAEAIEAAIDRSGEVRDAASPALAAARRESHQLATEIQQRLDRLMRSATLGAHLSDHYFTVRNDRYVLPVRADARGHVRGIVHDASGSGTTLFVEPEALVEPNNRRKQAEIEILREIRRVLRELSERAARVADSVERDLDTIALLDLAFARGSFADALEATAPEIGEAGVLRLPELRHPALPPDESVANDVHLGEGFHVLVVSGPNAGGKTVAMKAVALAALFARAGLHVPTAPGARIDVLDAILSDIGDEQSIGESLSTFSAHMANLARIVRSASERTLVVLDEIGVGTDPGEGAAIAQAVLETLADAGARVVATTHYGLLKEIAGVDPRFANASVEFDPETLAPTYRLHMGHPGSSSATAVAARMGMPGSVLERANRFLEREDRQLDRLLAELATARSALDGEQRAAARLREETTAARDAYRLKLERLQSRRDQLYRSMRDDLDARFKDAHEQIAGVIRELQRGGTAQAAARARERLADVAAETRRDESAAEVAPEPEETSAPVDWTHARAGMTVRIRGGGTGVLIALPDRRGNVAIQVGSARVSVPADRVAGADPPAPSRPPPAVSVESAPRAAADGEAGRCDLRGLRVDEAEPRLLAALDRAASAGRERLLVVHGIGTGALRRAVREQLAGAAYVERFENAGSDEGATLAILR